MARFIITTIIISLLLLGGGKLFFDELPGFFYESLILLVLSTIGLYRFLINVKREKPDFFITFYLATLAMRLIAYGTYIFIMVQLQPEMVMGNVVFFMTGYVIFTGVETFFLHRFVNRQ